MSKAPTKRDSAPPAWLQKLEQVSGRSLGPTDARRTANIAMAIDATGSMESVIADVRRNLKAIIERAKAATQAEIKIQFFAYRDYSDGSLLVESSELSGDISYLLSWLGQLSIGGGDDWEEAIEAGLAEALKRGKYDAAFVFGDARSRTAVELKRIAPQSRTAIDCARDLYRRGARVHTFWINSPGAGPIDHEDFRTIARAGGGVCGQLDGSEDMLHMAVMAIVERLQGAQAVLAYAEGRSLSPQSQQFKTLLLENKRDLP